MTVTSIRCLVFDFDGVLVDSNCIKEDAYFQIFGEAPGTRECIAEGTSSTPGDRYRKISAVLDVMDSRGVGLPAPTRSESIEVCARRYNDLCEDRTVSCPEIAGAQDTLLYLQESLIPAFVNSATPTKVLRRIVARRGWTSFFEGVFGSPSLKAETLQHISTRMEMPCRSMIMVGDRSIDSEAAAECGCQFVAIIGDYSDFPGTPRVTLKDLRGLPGLIDGLMAGSGE